MEIFAVKDDGAIKLLKNVHGLSDPQNSYIFVFLLQKLMINNDTPQIILCKEKNSGMVTDTSSPTYLQYEELKKNKQHNKKVRIKIPNPSKWTQKSDPGLK